MATTFEPRQTLWAQLEMRTSAGEVEQLRRAVGAEHVQANEDAAAEVRSLLRVWADFRAASDAEVTALRPAAPASLLPEPPNQREWLATQIRFHVENFRQASRDSGAADTDAMIPVETPRDRAVCALVVLLFWGSPHFVCTTTTVRYVCGDGKRGQRPMSAPSAKGGVVLVDTRNVSSARPATSSRGIRSALSLVSDPNAIEELRQSLADERRALLADAEYLRGCIEQETAFHRRCGLFSIVFPFFTLLLLAVR